MSKKTTPLTVLQLRDMLNKVLTDHGDLPVAVTLLDRQASRVGVVDCVHVVAPHGTNVLDITTLGKEPKSWS